VNDHSLRGVFITGTDTGVGKTVVAAAFLHRLRGLTRVRYWKPIQTGIEQDDDTATVRWLGACTIGEVFDHGVRLPRPLSPHLSARLHGVTITLESLMSPIAAESRFDRWIVEGAGGVLVPLNEHDLMVDLIGRLGLAVVVVARSALGTINHTVLTIHALRARSIPVAGVVMVGDQNQENRAAIERYGGVPVIGELPLLKPLTPGALRHAAAALADLQHVGACFDLTPTALALRDPGTPQ
jgi:dethiobiotin synthetase